MKIQLMLIGIISLLSTHKLAGQSKFDHTHEKFGQLLTQIVVVNGRQSRVDYHKLIAMQSMLNDYLQTLERVSKSEFEQFNDGQQLAFLINAYNGFQLLQVIEHYPIKSIRDIGSFLTTPWQQTFFTLLGKPTTLDHIEHGLIRTLFQEPRIHFAVNCAAISCPPLMNQAFNANALDELFEAAAINFINDTDANYYDEAKNTLYLSKIFDWYADDFGESLTTFVLSRMLTTQAKNINPNKINISYTRYHWSLNSWP